jgi:hypothetical protein
MSKSINDAQNPPSSPTGQVARKMKPPVIEIKKNAVKSSAVLRDNAEAVGQIKLIVQVLN